VLTFAVFLSAPQARASRDEKRKHRTHQNLDLSEGLRSILEKISTGVDSNKIESHELDTVDGGDGGTTGVDKHGEQTVNFEDCTLDAKTDTNAALERLAKCVQALNQYQTDQVSKAFKESGESNIKFEQQYQQALSLLNKIRDTAGLQNAKKEDTRRATDELISRLGEVKLLTEALKGKTITKTEKKPAEAGETGDSLLAEATSDEKQDQKSGDGVHALEIASETPPKSSGEQGNEGFDATNEKHDPGYGGGVSALEVAAETSPRGIAEQGDQDSDVDGNNRDRQNSSAGSPELQMKDFNLPGLSMATMGQE